MEAPYLLAYISCIMWDFVTCWNDCTWEYLGALYKTCFKLALNFFLPILLFMDNGGVTKENLSKTHPLAQGSAAFMHEAGRH